MDLGAKHRGFGMTAMEIIDATLRASGYPDAKTVLERRWIDEIPSFRAAHFLDGFATPDRRFHFAPDWKALGDNYAVMPKLPDQMDNIEAAGPDGWARVDDADRAALRPSSDSHSPHESEMTSARSSLTIRLRIASLEASVEFGPS